MNVIEELWKRHDELDSSVRALKDPIHRRDMQRFIKSCEALRTELSCEAVHCRRLHVTTPKFIEIKEKYEETLDLIEQYLTFACLLDS